MQPAEYPIRIRQAVSLLFFTEFKQIAGLTVKRLAQRAQRGKPHRADMSVFQLRQIDVGYPDSFRKLVKPDFSVSHHPVKPYNDLSHFVTLNRFVILLLQLSAIFEDRGEYEDDDHKAYCQ